ncbi:MAG: cupin domain-containing protein [Acidobacteria bacterium]|nr:cupin domain-containing protein [Acidobacteriota bacterium]
MANPTDVAKFAWNDMPRERVTNRIERRIVTGASTMVAHVYLEKGAIVPEHSHHNEQLAYILKGKLRFWVGDDPSQVFDVAEGEVLRLPSNVPHKAEALEETLDVDIFSPPRQDWLDHTDHYFKDQ